MIERILRALIPTAYVVTFIDTKGDVHPEIHWREKRAWARFRRLQATARRNGCPAPSLASRPVLAGV